MVYVYVKLLRWSRSSYGLEHCLPSPLSKEDFGSQLENLTVSKGNWNTLKSVQNLKFLKTSTLGKVFVKNHESAYIGSNKPLTISMLVPSLKTEKNEPNNATCWKQVGWQCQQNTWYTGSS